MLIDACTLQSLLLSNHRKGCSVVLTRRKEVACPAITWSRFPYDHQISLELVEEYVLRPKFFFLEKRNQSEALAGVLKGVTRRAGEAQRVEAFLTAALPRRRWNSRYHIYAGDLDV